MMPTPTTQRGYALTHAKMAQPFVHAPLFRSLEKGQQKQLKLDITYTVKDAKVGTMSTFRFWGPEPLGATDLRVLQGLVAVATGQSLVQGNTPERLGDDGSMRANLKLRGDALAHSVIAARFRLTAFAQTLGYVRPGRGTLSQLRDSIERLSAVTVVVRKPGFDGSYHILSGYERDTASDEVVVGLNPSLTAAVLGENEFLRVDFNEVRTLRSDAARLIHSRLHWINQGSRRPVSIETLCQYVYADESTASASTVRQRRRTVRLALKELAELGWGIEYTRPESVFVQRPAAKHSRIARHKITVKH